MFITYKLQKGVNKEKCDDSALIGSKVVNNESGNIKISIPCKIFIGDGVGGNNGGDKASLFIMKSIANITFGLQNKLQEQLIMINEKLIQYSKNILEYKEMATTLTGLIFEKEHVILVHCGNTRIYALQGRFLKQITSDQTTYQWLLARGSELIAEDCNKSEILGAFGGGNRRFLNTLIVENVFETNIPEKILMTSDGIHDVLTIDEIEDIVADIRLNSMEKVEQLIELAIQKGSLDDCTAILIEKRS